MCNASFPMNAKYEQLILLKSISNGTVGNGRSLVKQFTLITFDPGYQADFASRTYNEQKRAKAARAHANTRLAPKTQAHQRRPEPYAYHNLTGVRESRPTRVNQNRS